MRRRNGMENGTENVSFTDLVSWVVFAATLGFLIGVVTGSEMEHNKTAQCESALDEASQELAEIRQALSD